jgi:hypothetical protein
MNYCGIDLHSNNCVVIVSDENDRIVYQKRLPNELTQIAVALEPYRQELAGVVVESTYYAKFAIMESTRRPDAERQVFRVFHGVRCASMLYIIFAFSGLVVFNENDVPRASS